MLTEAEQKVISLLGQAYNIWAGCGAKGHDLDEFVAAIHTAQHQVMAQAAARLYPTRYRLAMGTTPLGDGEPDVSG